MSMGQDLDPLTFADDIDWWTVTDPQVFHPWATLPADLGLYPELSDAETDSGLIADSIIILAERGEIDVAGRLYDWALDSGEMWEAEDRARAGHVLVMALRRSRKPGKVVPLCHLAGAWRGVRGLMRQGYSKAAACAELSDNIEAARWRRSAGKRSADDEQSGMVRVVADWHDRFDVMVSRTKSGVVRVSRKSRIPHGPVINDGKTRGTNEKHRPTGANTKETGRSAPS